MLGICLSRSAHFRVVFFSQISQLQTFSKPPQNTPPVGNINSQIPKVTGWTGRSPLSSLRATAGGPPLRPGCGCPRYPPPSTRRCTKRTAPPWPWWALPRRTTPVAAFAPADDTPWRRAMVDRGDSPSLAKMG